MYASCQRGGSENAAKRKREDPSGGAQAERQPQRWDRAPVEKNNEAFNEYYKVCYTAFVSCTI